MEKILLENPWVLAIILAWTLPWKGLALWKSARRGHLGWFLAILILNTFALLEIIYLLFHRTKNITQKESNYAKNEVENIVRINPRKIL